MASWIAMDGWRLPEGLRDELKVPLGPIIQDRDLPDHVGGRTLAVVGDVAAVHVHKAGYRPKLVIVDFKTKRSDEGAYEDEVRLIGEECIRVVNPPAMITTDLWEAIERAYGGEASVRVEVEGEEDLAFIPCVLVAPKGSLVIYGMPDRGMVVVTVDTGTRYIVRKAFGGFERVVASD